MSAQVSEGGEGRRILNMYKKVSGISAGQCAPSARCRYRVTNDIVCVCVCVESLTVLVTEL